MQVREPSYIAPPEPAPFQPRRLGGATAHAPAAHSAAAAAQLRARIEERKRERRERAAAAAYAPSAAIDARTSPRAHPVEEDVTTAFERPPDARTEREEAALAAMGQVDTSTASLPVQADSPSALSPRQAVFASDDGATCTNDADVGARAGAEPSTQADARPASAATQMSDDGSAAPTAAAAEDARGTTAQQGDDADQQGVTSSAVEAMNLDDSPEGDASVQRVREVQAVLDGLASSPDALQVQAALGTVATIVANALAHPANEKFRKVCRSNKTFAARVLPCARAEVLLKLAGFVLDEHDTWSLGNRNDPGMLWLVHSLLRERIGTRVQHV